MPRKVDAARRRADLLAALARTANVRLSLRETGISACWAYRERRLDGDFDARWRTAVRAGQRALARDAATRARDPRAARVEAGLVSVGSSGKGTLRLARTKPTSFTEARRTAFIDALRATCNVKAAARATRVSAHAAYLHFHADAAFRAAWEAALAEGRVHLELALIGAARALVEGSPESARSPALPPVASKTITGMDAKVALQLVRLHGPRDAAGRARGRWVKAADADATRAEIMAKVAAVRAARGAEVVPSSSRS